MTKLRTRFIENLRLAGLRMMEAITLPVTAVDSRQMVPRVIGKGNMERALPLTEILLVMLRHVWS